MNTINPNQLLQQKLTEILNDLSAAQKDTLQKVDQQTAQLDKEHSDLLNQQLLLQEEIRNSKKDLIEKKRNNQKLEHDVNLLSRKVDVMEENVSRVVNDNVYQFNHYQEILHNNNINTDKMIEDLRSVQKQHFEMENINESLEQRIEQLKGQRDLSVLLAPTGKMQELEAQQVEATSLKNKLANLMTNTELAWQDKLVENMRELDDNRRQASDKSINEHVQKNLH